MKESKLKVLIADDNAPLEAIASFLERKGIQIETVESRDRFNDKIRHNNYDAIVVDGEFLCDAYNRENIFLDGAEAQIEFLRKERAGTAIIIYSGHSERLIRELVDKTDGFIRKSSTGDDFADRIKKIVAEKMYVEKRTITQQDKNISSSKRRHTYDPNWDKKDGD